MPVQKDENRAEGMNGDSAQHGRGHNGQWVEDVLARDRRAIRSAATERVAGGMYSRIAQAVKKDGNASTFQCRWAVVYVGLTALLITAFWIGISHNSLPPDSHATVQSIPAVPAPATIKSDLARAGTSSPVLKRMQPRAAAFRPLTRRPAQQPAPRQAVFPIEVAPNEQERIMMQIARNHPEQLKVIAQQFADDSSQLEDQRREFEEWLKKEEGGTI
jgi:hypothetical protein